MTHPSFNKHRFQNDSFTQGGPMFLHILFSALIGFFTIGPTWAAEPTRASSSIDLEKAVHFLTADGSDVVIPPGTYQVEAAESWLRVIPGERREAWLLMATAETHKEEVDTPIAFTVPGEEDELFLVLMLPDGKNLETLGTYSGVRSRAVRRLSSARRYRALQAARSRARAPRRTIPTLGPEPNVRTFRPKDKYWLEKPFVLSARTCAHKISLPNWGNHPGPPFQSKGEATRVSLTCGSHPMPAQPSRPSSFGIEQDDGKHSRPTTK